MGMQEVISWYQKKIGTYDKQQWENKIEQRILHGLKNIHMTSTKLDETDFIDLDLVQGSSFTKAKPKHSFVTVARLATLRFLFLPLYSKWWIQQTSYKIFSLLFLLYVLQLFNIAVYLYNTSGLPEDSTENVPCTEIVVPVLMMWVLSLIHSQIVSTHTVPEHAVCSQKHIHYRLRHRAKKLAADRLATEANSNLRKKDSTEKPIRVNRKNVQSKSVFFESAERTEDDNLPECSQPSSGNARLERHPKRTSDGQLMDDDGFESLNGSPSDNGDDNATPKNPIPEQNPAATISKTSLELPEVSPIKSNNNNTEAVKSDGGTVHENVESEPKVGWSHSYGADSSSDDSVVTKRINTAEPATILRKRRRKQISRTKYVTRNKRLDSSSYDSEDAENMIFERTPSISNTTGSSCPLFNEATTSATEWMGITTNSEDSSSGSDAENGSNVDHFPYDAELPPSIILNPSCAPSDKVSCTIWKNGEVKKAELSVLDISSAIISRVQEMPESMDYFYVGVFISTVLALLPIAFRLSSSAVDSASFNELQLSVAEISNLLLKKLSGSMLVIAEAALGTTMWERTIMITACFQRWVLACLLFFLLTVAECTFKQRYLYAKLFSHLTSSRRARKSELPHFRLNKVRNIKTWLSVRSYLRKRGPQRSVDVIVSTAFVVTLLLVSFLSMEILKDSMALQLQYNLEAMIWCVGLGFLLLRFITLGTNINQKYRSNLSILITEQINLYLQVERKPHKKDELNVANSVIKLAADLLKELETPFKISGFNANSILYTITKVFVVSLVSGVLSEMLGFKLKLHKIKIK